MLLSAREQQQEAEQLQFPSLLRHLWGTQEEAQRAWWKPPPPPQPPPQHQEERQQNLQS